MAVKDAIFFELFPHQINKGDLKRYEIIVAAIDCFAKDGFQGGTFESVAKKLKKRRSHVAYYFKDKDELFISALHYIIAQAQKITIDFIAQKKAPLEQVLAMSDAAFEWAEQYPKQAKVLMLFYYSAASEAKFKKMHTDIRSAGLARLEALICEEFKSRRIEAGVEAATYSRSLHSLMTGFVIDQITTNIGSEVDLKLAARTAYTQFFDALPQGVQALPST
jgi:AcrR family transcriptional regulator